MNQLNRDYLHLHFIVLIWGFTAILGLLIELPSVEMVFYRTLFASIALLFVVKGRRVDLRIRNRTELWIILCTGLIIAAHWITFFLAARISNVSACLAGMATCSLWTSIIEPISLGRKVRGFEVILGAIAVVGIIVIFNVEFDYLSGILVALISAFLAAVFSVINGRYSRKYDPYLITLYEMVGGCIGLMLFFPIYGHFMTDQGIQLTGTIMDFVWLSILALVCTVYAYSISVALMKRLSVFSINLTVNLEPVYGIILALLFFGEKEEMSRGFYIGTMLILISVLLYPVLNKRFGQKALSTDLMR